VASDRPVGDAGGVPAASGRPQYPTEFPVDEETAMASDPQRPAAETAPTEEAKAKFREALDRKNAARHRTADCVCEHGLRARLGDRRTGPAHVPPQVRLSSTPDVRSSPAGRPDVVRPLD